MNTPKFERAIVVGATSGIGWELAKQLAARGTKVVGVGRREERLKELSESTDGQVVGMVHDVRETDRVPALFDAAVKELGGLDLIIYNAGVMPFVAPTEFDFAKDKEMILVNFLGAVAWLNLAALRFQSTGSGTIIGVGSVAGDRGRAGQPIYNASKAALHCYLEALRNRLHRKGVTVVTIKPGPVRTEMTEALKINLRGAMTAERAAREILKRSGKAGEHYLKFSHKIIFRVLQWVPSPIFRKLNL